MTRQLYVAIRNILCMTVGYIISAWPGLSDGLMVARRSLRAHVRFQCAQTRRPNAQASNTNIDVLICTRMPVLSVLDVPKLVWPIRIPADATMQLCLHCTQVKNGQEARIHGYCLEHGQLRPVHSALLVL